jgi:hypothetical protein
MWTAPSASDFKTFFARDFNFAPASDATNDDFVMDSDLTRAIAEAEMNFNSSLYGDDDKVTIVFMYLAAFHLVVNLQNSSKGISSQSKFPVSSNSVGGVSISFAIPERYTKDAFLNQYTQNGYGMKYLSMALPHAVGVAAAAYRETSFR